jgi:hypothetical protein
MHLFALGLDNQVYEQDFNTVGHSSGAYYLTSPGAVKDFVLGHDNLPQHNIELFVVGLDDQVYEQDFGYAGDSISSYYLTTPGEVKKIGVGYDQAGLMELFAMGLDDQVYEQDFGTAGQSTSSYYLTSPGAVKDFSVGRAKMPFGVVDIELFVIGLDNQVYRQIFGNISGHDTSGYYLTTPGEVKKIDVGYDATGLIHLFAIGLDDQVYEQDFNDHGFSTDSFYLTKAGQVKDLGIAYETNGYLSTGHDNVSNPQLVVIGLDDQVYQQRFGPDGHSVSSYVLTAPGQVQAV